MRQKKEVLISVIIPVYNTEEYLEQCIQSVISQTFSSYEIIVVNDGSTDESGDILERYESQFENFCVITQENEGLGAARNIGFLRAKGKYVYFLDSDDYIDPNLLMKCYEMAEETSSEVVLFDDDAFYDGTTEYFDEYNRKDIIPQNEVISGMEYITKYYLRCPCPVAQLMFIRREFLVDNNILFPVSILYEDNEFHCKVMVYAQKVVYNSQILYHRRYRAGSITNTEFTLKKGKDLYQIASNIYMLRIESSSKSNMIFSEIAFHILFTAYSGFASIRKCKEALDAILEIERFAIELSIQSDCNRLSLLASKFNQIYDCADYSESANKIIAMISERIRHSLGKWLDDPKAVIGLYGKGKYAQRFVSFCDAYLQNIEASFVYIDSVEKSGTINADGRVVFNVNNLIDSQICVIFTASIKYEDEMTHILEGLYGSRFPIMRLYGEVGF